MFRVDPPPPRAANRTVAVVGGAVGLTAALRDAGWGVLPVAPLSRLPVDNVYDDYPADESDRVRLAVEAMPVSAVVFAGDIGSAFRTLQVRAAGLSLTDAVVALLPGDDARNAWPERESDLDRLHMQRYARANADGVFASLADLVTALSSLRPPASPHSAGPLVTAVVPHYNLGAHLPATLASLAAQTYPRLEVVCIDDGSTDAASRHVFDEMTRRYPHFRFIRQDNSGIGATRNRGLALGSGEYYLPMDADNVAAPTLVESLARAAVRRPHLAAVSCYFHAFRTDADLAEGRFAYAYRPTGGPRVLGCLRNVYGDACSLFRADAFRAVGGFGEDRGTSFEDWELFVKLVSAGYEVDVAPEPLLYYRHLDSGFSRTTDPRRNHERVLRQYRAAETLPADERAMLWSLLAGLNARAAHLTALTRSRRFRVAERLYSACTAAASLLRSLPVFGRDRRQGGRE